MDLRTLQSDPRAFRQALRIDADGRVIRLADALDPWQEADFESLDGAWKAVCGHEKAPGTRLRAYLERPRGHSKSTDISVQCLFALFASKKPLAGYACAADREQAALIRAAIQRLVSLNPWLEKIIRVDSWKALNKLTGSTLEIISSDVGSSYGILPDFVICDELTHWQDQRGRDLFDSLLSSAAKKSTCLMLIISNAGWGESWQWSLREQVRSDPSWIFSRLDGPQASWISADALAEQRRLLPRIAFDRLWMNEWSAGIGDALSSDDIKATIKLTGPLAESERGWWYVGGLDLGIARDRCAFVVLGVHCGYSESVERPRTLSRHQQLLAETGLWELPAAEFDEHFEQPTGRLKLARVVVWNPRETGRVDLEEVERTIIELDKRFHMQVAADVWNAEYLIQRCTKAGVRIEGVNFTGQNLVAMASATLSAFSEKLIDLYDDPELIRDLHSLKVEEKSYGVRLAANRSASTGHADAGTALSLALMLAQKIGKSNLGAFSHSDTLIVA